MKSLLKFIRTMVLPRLHDPLALLLVGSHAEGNANAASDIDLIAVAAAPKATRYRIKKREFEVEGRVIGVDSLTENQLRRRLEALDRIYSTGRHGVDGVATRIADSVLVHDTMGVGRKLIDDARRFRPAPETLKEMARVCLTFYQDVMGSIDERDSRTAILMARQAATIAIDCFLLQQGFHSLKPKWHLRRLQTTGAKDVLSRYQRVLGVDMVNDPLHAACILAELDRLVCEVLRISNVQEFECSPLWTEAGRLTARPIGISLRST